jgi:uncharacterized protein
MQDTPHMMPRRGQRRSAREPRHRIRVQVSSGAHPRYARNPGTGEDPFRATRLVAAEQEVFHDPQRPSSVTLTVAPPGSEPTRAAA